jgi:feruloyl esterase
VTVGNALGAGGINYAGMGVGLRADCGHNSTLIDGTWESLGVEVAIDFGDPAVHLSTVYAKSITAQFYKKGIYHSYYAGRSSDGKQVMSVFLTKGPQVHPNVPFDFGGVLVGAPAYKWANLDGFVIRLQSFVENTTSPGYSTPAQFSLVATRVTQACDLIDHVPDGVISNPRICTFDPQTLLCENLPLNTTHVLRQLR